MVNRRPVILFFVKLALIYAAFAGCWPLARGAYAAFYCGMGGACYSWFGKGGSVAFARTGDGGSDPDVIAMIVNTSVSGSEIKKPMGLSTRYTGFAPTIVTASLVLALPLPWRRRLRAMGIALVIVNLFIVLWMGLSIWDEISEPVRGIATHGFVLPAWIKAVLHFVVVNLAESVVACGYVVPVLIWLATAFWKKDRERLMGALITLPRD